MSKADGVTSRSSCLFYRNAEFACFFSLYCTPLNPQTPSYLLLVLTVRWNQCFATSAPEVPSLRFYFKTLPFIRETRAKERPPSSMYYHRRLALLFFARRGCPLCVFVTHSQFQCLLLLYLCVVFAVPRIGKDQNLKTARILHLPCK